MPPDDASDQSYYPSAKAKLLVRFDEFGRRDLVVPQRPTKRVTSLKGTKNDRSPLAPQQYTDPVTGAVSYRLLPIASGQSGPQKQGGGGALESLTAPVGAIIPRRADWGMGGLRSADTLSMEFHFVDLPVDPRCIRACAVEFYLGTVTADEFAMGMQGVTRGQLGTGSSDATPLNVVPDTYLDGNGRQRTNLRFEGWVDEWETDFPKDSEPLVKLTCTDNFTLLREQEMPPGLCVDVTKRIDESVAVLLSNFPQMQDLSVIYMPQDPNVAPPVLGEALAKTAFRPDLGGAAMSKGGAAASNKLSVIDYLTDVCGALGLTIRVRGSDVLIQRPRTLYSNKFGGRADDPYQPRTLQNGLELQRRHFILGRNIVDMKIGRKFSKRQPKNVEIRCYSTLRKKTLVVRYPTDVAPTKGKKNKSKASAGTATASSKLLSSVHPGTGRAEEGYKVVTITGIESEKTLRIIAQSYYELVGRNEFAVSIKTENLASFGGGNLDPDILDMDTGDSFELKVNRDPGSTATQVEDVLLTPFGAPEFLRFVGYDGKFADLYAKAYNDAGFLTAFKLKSLGVSWDSIDGVSLDIHGINYLEVRMDADLPDGEEEEPMTGVAR